VEEEDNPRRSFGLAVGREGRELAETGVEIGCEEVANVAAAGRVS
jgi:hypothetical protein